MAPMPGTYQSQEHDEIDLPLTEDEAYSPSAEELELTIGNAIETTDEDDDDDDDNEDEDYVDNDYDDMMGHGDLDIDLDEDFDEDGNYIGDDPELAEAERLAAAADLAENGEDSEDDDEDTEQEPEPEQGNASGYTLAIDPTTSRVYLVDSEGNHQELNTGEDTTGTGRRSTSNSDTLSILGRLLGRRSLRPAGRTTSRIVDDDDDDDGDEEGIGMFQYGFRGGRKTADGLFPPASEPVEAGVELERKGLFGRPGLRYNSAPHKRFSPYNSNINDTLRAREYRQPQRTIQRFDLGDASVPNSPGTEVAKYDANIYCGQYSQDGSFFYTCAQDYKIRIYDMQTPNTDKATLDSQERQSGRRYRQYRMYYDEDKSSLPLTKTIQAREHLSSWTITDANLSPDNTKMIWSTIGPVVGMTRVRESADDMETYDDGDGQVALDFGAGRSGGRRHFGIWSVRFSADGREIVAGAGSGSIYVYDLESRRTVLSIFAHEDDVNAVCFADTASSNVLVSGSDDNYLKVWDRRSLGDGGSHTKASGILVGHTEGITYVDPKGDGRFVLSNGKDQTCKLWDLRMMYSDDQFSKLDRLDVSVRNYDYRHGLYRKPRFAKHPHDRSLMTYTGHTVLRTLIRCHFSPESTTGQHYIYSGSYDGRIHIWNLDGTVRQVLDRSHTMPLLTRGSASNAVKMNDPSQPDRPLGTYPTSSSSPVVRDVSWAPYSPNIMSSAWTESGGSLAMHEWKGYGKRQEQGS